MAADSTTAVRDEYERLAEEYDKRWSDYVANSVGQTVRRAAVQPRERVLDVGCGTGVLLRTLQEHVPSAVLAGADLAPAMIGAARHRLGDAVALAVADAARLPFASSDFDVVISTSSLHYWPEPARALAEFTRVLRLGGRLVLTDWCDDYWSCKLWDLALRVVDGAHRRALGTDTCRRLLVSSGYVVTSLDRYKINWLWGLMTVVARPVATTPSSDSTRSPRLADQPSQTPSDAASQPEPPRRE